VRKLTSEAVEVSRRTGDPWVAAWTKMISALVTVLAGDPVTTRPWASEAVDEFAELGDSWSRASASMALAFAHVQLGELEAAEAALEGSVPALVEVGDLKMANGCLIAYGLIARLGGNSEEAEKHYGDALDLCVEAGDPANAPVCLEGIAAAVAMRDPERAARLLGAARALYDAGHFPNVPGFEAFYAATRTALDDGLGAESAEQLRARGASSARTVPLADVAQV
jgi:tetratricopeptide (TPR) repeat protein